ncbi:hypothetical protein [Clostridium guangxiense]|uniref:hypothetical protein n=1 Tax=Clostridium guangxiense TaxID=1662055 RepID=UPI001E421D48|nr:hypothetical protein [Clostridium guangxiense]MCD2347272.1 hypothetical protein [Clostridium guangxiense]
MARPSIFSNQYDRQVRRRKRRKKIIVFLVCCLGIYLVVKIYLGINFNGVSFKNIATKLEQEQNKKEAANKKSSERVSKTTKGNSTTKPNKNESKDQVVNAKLADGKQVIVTYNISGNVRKIKSVNLNGVDGEYNISPSSQNLIIYEKAGQNMYYVDANGNVSDITYKTYTSTSGTTFSKDNIIQSNQNYIWCASPKFIDDNTVVYISQLPWFDNRTDKYVWRTTIKDKAYANTNIHGNDVKINGMTDKGIEIVTDTTTQYMKADGTTTN